MPSCLQRCGCFLSKHCLSASCWPSWSSCARFWTSQEASENTCVSAGHFKAVLSFSRKSSGGGLGRLVAVPRRLGRSRDLPGAVLSHLEADKGRLRRALGASEGCLAAVRRRKNDYEPQKGSLFNPCHASFSLIRSAFENVCRSVRAKRLYQKMQKIRWFCT